MGRKSKPVSLRAAAITCSFPPSFKNYLQPLGASPSGSVGVSQALQALIAQKVHGLTMADFKAAYGDPVRDVRFKPDPLEQEYVRVARWILESQILGIYLWAPEPGSGQQLWGVKVQWLVTGVTMDLRTDVCSTTPGFRHVIYDDALLNMCNMFPKHTLYQELATDAEWNTYFKGGALSKSYPLCEAPQPFKAQILWAWLLNSREQHFLNKKRNI